MARKLKTFQTSLGFYDLAIAAPSMKAALEAWGAGSNLFHQGAAKETDDPDIVAATMSKPGVVLKRPAGSKGRFAEHSDLPSDLGSGENGTQREKRRPKPAKRTAPKISEREAQKTAADFEKEQKRREVDRRRDEAAMARSGSGRSRRLRPLYMMRRPSTTLKRPPSKQSARLSKSELRRRRSAGRSGRKSWKPPSGRRGNSARVSPTLTAVSQLAHKSDERNGQRRRSMPE
ncbi:colicin import membrane protein [Bradyrhizobium diazoefficiens]